MDTTFSENKTPTGTQIQWVYPPLFGPKNINPFRTDRVGQVKLLHR